MPKYVVQFPHPGGEGYAASLAPGAVRPWPLLSDQLPHVRKFVVSAGTATNGVADWDGEFDFWAEWEPPSEIVRILQGQGKTLPFAIQRPLLPHTSPAGHHQNTDPMVFGDAFYYSNCRQHNWRKPPNRPRRSEMQNLDPGSLILFGSMVGGEFVLDTVFVVAGSEVMTPGETAPPSELLARTVTAPLASGGGEPLDYRLYRGASPAEQVDGMFSFVPCRPHGGEAVGFARPIIRFPWMHKSAQRARLVPEHDVGSVKDVWDTIVDGVLDQDLLLGVAFDAPTVGGGLDVTNYSEGSNEMTTNERQTAPGPSPEPNLLGRVSPRSDGRADEPISNGLPPKVAYDELSSKQKEIYNYQKVAALLADYGFNCIKLADDWQGADFLAYHKDGDQTLKVQLKGRLTIDHKYLGKGLHMAFPIHGVWHIIEHDALVEHCGQHTNWLSTESWAKGSYNSTHPNASLKAALQPFALVED